MENQKPQQFTITRFDRINMDPASLQLAQGFKLLFDTILKYGSNLPNTLEKTMMIAHLDSAFCFAEKSIQNMQLQRMKAAQEAAEQANKGSENESPASEPAKPQDTDAAPTEQAKEEAPAKVDEQDATREQAPAAEETKTDAPASEGQPQ